MYNKETEVHSLEFVINITDMHGKQYLKIHHPGFTSIRFTGLIIVIYILILEFLLSSLLVNNFLFAWYALFPAAILLCNKLPLLRIFH